MLIEAAAAFAEKAKELIAETLKEGAENTAPEPLQASNTENSLLSRISFSPEAKNNFPSVFAPFRPEAHLSPFERAGIERIERRKPEGLGSSMEGAPKSPLVEEQVARLSQTLKTERYPSKFCRDVLKRLLDNKDRFNEKAWQKADIATRKKMLYDVYNVVMEELGIPASEIKRTALDFKDIDAEGLYYRSNLTEGANETLHFESNGIILNNDLLKDGRYIDAVKAIYHETMHKFQSYVLETNSPFPYPELRKEWFDADLKQLRENPNGGLMEYFLSPQEMFSYQQADYFAKVYQIALRTNETVNSSINAQLAHTGIEGNALVSEARKDIVSFGSRESDIRGDLSNAGYYDKSARDHSFTADSYARDAKNAADNAAYYAKNDPSKVDSYLSKAREYESKAASERSAAGYDKSKADSYRSSASSR